jgi:hypothetical protein
VSCNAGSETPPRGSSPAHAAAREPYPVPAVTAVDLVHQLHEPHSLGCVGLDEQGALHARGGGQVEEQHARFLVAEPRPVNLAQAEQSRPDQPAYVGRRNREFDAAGG